MGDAGARSADERGGISAQVRERRQETTKIDEEKRQATAEIPETGGQGAAKVAEGRTKERRQGQPATSSEVARGPGSASALVYLIRKRAKAAGVSLVKVGQTRHTRWQIIARCRLQNSKGRRPRRRIRAELTPTASRTNLREAACLGHAN